MYFLHYTSCIESKNIMLREFLAADVQRIIGIRPIRTMLQQVLFCLSQLLPGLLETIPSPADPSHQRTGSNRARELHPHPLTEPCVKVSPHTALHTQRDCTDRFHRPAANLQIGTGQGREERAKVLSP